jgi:hypothetical protein
MNTLINSGRMVTAVIVFPHDGSGKIDKCTSALAACAISGSSVCASSL